MSIAILRARTPTRNRTLPLFPGPSHNHAGKSLMTIIIDDRDHDGKALIVTVITDMALIVTMMARSLVLAESSFDGDSMDITCKHSVSHTEYEEEFLNISVTLDVPQYP